MQAVSLTPHAQKNFEQLRKVENHMQNSDGMQKELTGHAVSLTPHARFLRSKIDHISVNSKENSKRL
jgi:hypothetical protein